MKLADRSPGLVLVLAAVVVYGMILIEIAMYMVGTAAFMAGTLALAVVAAVAIARWFHTLVEDGAEADDAVKPEPVRAAAPVVIAKPKRPARPSAARLA